jgi:hypothetical protein
MNEKLNFPNYLKRALRALNLTNKQLSNLLSEARWDGQKTSETTISRWLTGISNPDPALILYLKTQLIQLANVSPLRPLVGKAISFGGAKGGVGSSVLSIGVTLALNQMGYKVQHVSNGENCFNKHLINQISKFIDCVVIKTDLKEYLHSARFKFDFIVVDQHNRFISQSDDSPDIQQLLKSIDLLVLPLNICSPLEIWALKDANLILDKIQANNRLLIHFSKNIINVDRDLLKLFLNEMDKWLDSFSENGMPMVDGEVFVTGKVENFKYIPTTFQSLDLENRYLKLTSEILEKTGIDIDSRSPKDLNFFELVDRVSPKKQAIVD